MEMYKALPSKLTKPGKVKKQILAHGAHRMPPKEYRESGATEGKDYGDISNKKYPIHTESHVRAAISYFSKPKNANVYTPQQQKAIWGRIHRAAKKFGITTGKKSGPPSVEKSLEMIDSMIKSVTDPKSGFRRNSNEHNGFTAALKHHSQGMDEHTMRKQMHPDNHPKWNAGYQQGMNHLRMQSAKTTKKKDSEHWALARQHKKAMDKFNNAADGHKYAAHMIAQRAHETAHEVPSDHAKHLAKRATSDAQSIGDRKSFYENAKMHHERQAAKHLEHATGSNVSPKGSQLHEEAMNRHLRASEKASRALKEPGRHLGYGVAAAHANTATVHAHKETQGMVEKSLEMIEGMIKSAKSVRLMPDPDKKSVEKGTESEDKAYLGTLKPGEGFTGSGSAPRGYHPGPPQKVKQKVSDKDAKRMGWTTAKMEETIGKRPMEKALKASDLPRIPRAIRMKMEEMSPYHRAMMRVSQANSRFQDKYQGPLQGEFLEDPTVSKSVEVDEVCNTCGRTYFAKSENAGCPSCTVEKAMYCNKCGNPLQKSQDGSLTCSLCR